jgi:hypothetical protein
MDMKFEIIKKHKNIILLSIVMFLSLITIFVIIISFANSQQLSKYEELESSSRKLINTVNTTVDLLNEFSFEQNNNIKGLAQVQDDLSGDLQEILKTAERIDNSIITCNIAQIKTQVENLKTDLEELDQEEITLDESSIESLNKHIISLNILFKNLEISLNLL